MSNVLNESGLISVRDGKVPSRLRTQLMLESAGFCPEGLFVLELVQVSSQEESRGRQARHLVGGWRLLLKGVV